MAATRFYLQHDSTGGQEAAAVSPAFGSQWDGGTTNAARFRVKTTKQDTALASQTSANYTSTSATPCNRLHRQFVSDALPAQTISGTFSAVIRGSEDTTDTDASLQVVVRVVSNDGSTERGVPYPGHSATVNATGGALGEEFSTSSQTRIFSGVALTPLAIQANDRLVIEIGQRRHNTLNASRQGRLTFGDPTATNDFALTSGLTTSLCPWVEFSADLFNPSSSLPPKSGFSEYRRHLLVR